MSRCFPFPPPGYEKKTRPDEEVNLLIKENPKEKKQKKDKKDKEKKERREKDKEKSSEKHREKKEKKHKHTEKKEKNRDKEEKKTSEEKKIVGLLDNQNSENFGLTGLHVDETQKSRLLLDLGKKVRNDNGAKEMQIVERITAPDIKSPGKVLEHKAGILDDGNQKFKDKREENRIPNGQTVKVNAIGLANGFVRNFPPKDQKNIEGSFYQEDKVMEKQKERKDSNKHKDTDGRGDKHKGRDGEKKSKSKDKKRKKEKEKENAKELSSPMSSKLKESGSNTIDLKIDKGSYLFKESNVQNVNKRKEPEMDGLLDGLETQNNKLPRLLSSSHQVVQTGNRIESSTGNQFDLEKEATVQKHKSDASSSSTISLVENGRKLAMAHIAINIVPERQEAVGKHGKASDSLSSLKPTLGTGRNLVSCQAVRSFTDLEQGVTTNNTKDKKVLSSRPVTENGNKLGSNQFNNLNGRNLESCQSVRSFTDLEQGMATNNTKDKKVLSSQTVAENGRKLGSSQFNNLNAAERQGAACNPKLSGKESGSNGFVVPKLNERSSTINGLVELKKPSACSKGLPSASLPQKENVEMRMKPPHPDAKYLSEILSVPKVEWSWSDVDEQKWLFGSEDHQTKKPKYVSPMIEESKQVWAEALQIESADITALPYVIPY